MKYSIKEMSHLISENYKTNQREYKSFSYVEEENKILQATLCVKTILPSVGFTSELGNWRSIFTNLAMKNNLSKKKSKSKQS